MELSLIRDRFSYAENIFSETHTTEEAMEMIVPDAMPDILRIVSADAMVLIRSKDTAAERVTIGGVAMVSVIYAPDGESGLRCVNLELPFRIAADSGRITTKSTAAVKLLPCAASAIALNPRKISARVNIAAEISCFEETELEIPASIADGDYDCIEALSGEMEVSLPVEVLEKTFVASCEYQMPVSGPPAGEILRTSVSLEPQEVKVVGSKLIFKGTTTVSILFGCADSGEVSSCSFDTEYSQIIELEHANADSEFEIIPLLTGAYIEGGSITDTEGRRFAAELHIAAQCVAHSKVKLRYISDAYSSKFALEATTASLSLRGVPTVRSIPAALRAALEAPELSRVVSVSARTNTPVGTLATGEYKLTVSVEVEALYITNDGTVRTASGTFSVDAAISDFVSESDLRVVAKCSGDVYSVPADGGLEVRVPIDISVLETKSFECTHISEISMDDEAPLDLSSMPSLVIARVSNSDSLWTLAKRHHSTCELISGANELEEDAVLPGVLVIPKKR